MYLFILVILVFGFYLFLSLDFIEKSILYLIKLFSINISYPKIRICICIGLGMIILCVGLSSEIKTQSNSISKDKQVAMYPVVSKRYLSKTPDDFTVGKYRNRYFKIPIDTNNIKHCLIIGAPGSFKSSTLLNSLIWNFNFEKNKTPPVIYCIDCKPELSRKSIDESRDDVKIIDPSINSGCGFDVWYGLDQDDPDDRLVERADLIARTLITNPSGNSDNEFFYISAQNLMVPFLVYGFRKDLGFVETILQIIRIPLQDLITTILMDEDMQTDHPKVIGMLTPLRWKGFRCHPGYRTDTSSRS